MNSIARVSLNRDRFQSIRSHLFGTAEIGRSSLENIGLGAVEYFICMIHDAGKLSDEFGSYIMRGDPAERGSVNHSAAGALYVYNKYYLRAYKEKNMIMALTAQLIINSVYSHHGRLYDCINTDAENIFKRKMDSKSDCGYEEIMQGYFEEIISERELDKLFDESCKEIKEMMDRLKKFRHFGWGMVQKLLYSALIDADRYDAFCFESWQENYSIVPDWDLMKENLGRKLDSFDCKTGIDKMRRYISDTCAAASQRGNGVYRLSVPTGAGKTLASLRYALNCAEDKKHIFYIIPYTTILDQTADEIRAICGEDNVLEHHSGVVSEDDEYEKNERYRLLTDRWNSPIVLTTLVQFMNALYAGKPSCARRMRSLADSVIIFDEVQAMPYKIVSLFNEAVNFLVEVCGCTVLLCTATQPTFDSLKEHRLRLSENCELVQRDDDEYKDVFRRSKVIDMCANGSMSCEEIAKLAEREQQKGESVLIIANTVSEAVMIYNAVNNGSEKILLTSKKCRSHRKKIISEIKEKTKSVIRGENEGFITVSTQLVEAGVDFSFSCVIRALAGLDNLAQSAGRCNRSGEFGRLCNVYLVDIKDEKLEKLEDIRRAKDSSRTVIKFDKGVHELLSKEMINRFYRKYYDVDNSRVNPMNYEYAEGESTLMQLLSDNAHYVSEYKRKHTNVSPPMLVQAFETAGKAFRVIENNTYTVIVPYEEGEECISVLEGGGDFNDKIKALKKSAAFSVNIYNYEFEKLKEKNALYFIEEVGVWALSNNFYNEEYGLYLYAELEFLGF